ncbi:MAG TPA: tetratricopeptide repeat protein [Paraburkholderia sp.]
MTMANEDEAGPDVLVTRADVHFAARRMTDAAACYRQVIARRPGDAYALHRMSLVSVHLGDLDGAREYIGQALQLTPDKAELWEHAGILAALNGNHELALGFYDRALGLSGSTASLHRNVGDSLRLAGRPSEALYHYGQAIGIQPTFHYANRALARTYTDLGNTRNALVFWLRAWALQPAASKEDLDTIVSIIESGHTELVDETIEQIVHDSGNDTSSLKAVAYVLVQSMRHRDALAVAMRGLTIDPENVSFSHCAGRALRYLGKVAESLPYMRAVARVFPHDPSIHYELSGVLLCLGEFEEGWRQAWSFYEIPANRETLRWPNFPAWNGESVCGRYFLLVGEQGLGDQIQFLRFAVWLHQQGATVDVLVDGPVAVLAASMASIRRVFVEMPEGPYDFWTHMFRVPAHIRLNLTMLPVATSYVASSPDKVHQWSRYIETSSPRQWNTHKKRVGIVWAGNPNLYLDRFRSICLDAMRDLFLLPGFAWYSLQKGEREPESEALEHEFDVHTLGPLIHGYDDTLAILHSLDLLITVDSSVAHLAGAAGLPVWTLIPAYTDWRWMTGRTDSPWYPSMRLFRQRELCEWAPVITEVRDALVEWHGETTA